MATINEIKDLQFTAKQIKADDSMGFALLLLLLSIGIHYLVIFIQIEQIRSILCWIHVAYTMYIFTKLSPLIIIILINFLFIFLNMKLLFIMASVVNRWSNPWNANENRLQQFSICEKHDVFLHRFVVYWIAWAFVEIFCAKKTNNISTTVANIAP